MNPCTKKVKRKFLFWNWNDEETRHDFSYINRELRRCDRCKLQEVFIKAYYNNGILQEDWRKSK